MKLLKGTTEIISFHKNKRMGQKLSEKLILLIFGKLNSVDLVFGP